MDVLILTALLVALVLGSAAVVTAIDRAAAPAPRRDDATVTAAFALADWPSDGDTAVTVAVANPGPAPVLVSLSLRRVLLPGARPRVTVPRRTTGPRYRPSRHAVVAAVPEATVAGLTAPVPDGRRYRLIVMIGQSDGRLCVLSAPFRIARSGGAAAAGSVSTPLPLR